MRLSADWARRAEEAARELLKPKKIKVRVYRVLGQGIVFWPNMVVISRRSRWGVMILVHMRWCAVHASYCRCTLVWLSLFCSAIIAQMHNDATLLMPCSSQGLSPPKRNADCFHVHGPYAWAPLFPTVNCCPCAWPCLQADKLGVILPAQELRAGMLDRSELLRPAAKGPLALRLAKRCTYRGCMCTVCGSRLSPSGGFYNSNGFYTSQKPSGELPGF